MPRQFFAMIRVELLKVFTQWSGIGAVVMAVMVPLATLFVLYIFGGTSVSSSVQGQAVTSMIHFDVVGATGWALYARNFIILPLMLILATGASVAGEQSDRTLRELVVRPVPRWSILVAKQVALWALSVVTLAVTLVTALGLGWAIFGAPSVDPAVAEGEESLVRVICGFAVCFLSDVALIALATTFSTVVRSVGGVVVSLAVVLIADRAVWAFLSLLEFFKVEWAPTAVQFTLVSVLGAWSHWENEYVPIQFLECAGLVAAAWALSIARFARTDVP
ncbi:hypothetical protein LBMAG42_15450 [Deltaproteobacteria bacterium]|nr:hypothetical protein LBMAG42_15450 [Deltaproteobacteria bacterium]